VKREFRLTRTIDFERVRHMGKSFPHPLVVLVAMPNQLETSRIGVAAGRSVGNAVLRSRAKRILRAGIDEFLPGLMPGWDLILLARKPLPDAGFWKTRAALEIVLRKAKLFSLEPGTHE